MTPGRRMRLAGRTVMTFMVVMAIMTGASVICVVAHGVTFGRARRVCLNRVCPWAARLIMAAVGIQVRFHNFEGLGQGPFVVTINHSSTLDIVLVSMLPIANKRAFLYRGVKKFLPLAVLGKCAGTFFTPPQSRPEQRRRCFQRAERILRKTGDSVCLTPEGMRWTDGPVGPFNKGVFHLATNLGWPILPLYIDIPRAINPGMGFATWPGVIDVYARPLVQTRDWKLDDVSTNRDALRAAYLAYPQGWRAGWQEGETTNV